MANEKNKTGGSSSLFAKLDIKTFAMFGGLILIWIIFTVLTDGIYIVPRNISNLIRQAAIVAILGIGMVQVIVTGNIDLSVGSLMGLAGGIAGALMVWNDWGTIPTIFVILLIGGLAGLLHGVIVAYVKVPAFIVTLGAMMLYRGVLIGITEGVSIAPMHETYRILGQAYISKNITFALGVFAAIVIIFLFYNSRRKKVKHNLIVEPIQHLVIKSIVILVLSIGFVYLLNIYNGMPVPVLVMFLLLAIFTFITQNTTFGRSLYAIGGNTKAAKYSGINVNKTTVLVFVINGLIAAIAGIILSARLNAASPSAGNMMEMNAIAVAVIGGASLMGGKGKVYGALFGALVIASLDNGMSLLGLEAFWQYVVKGVVLVLAVAADVAVKNNKA